MIIRTYFECLTCGQKHIFRIQIGYSSFQKHETNCMSCHEKMIISLKLNQAQGKIEELSAVENCEDISNEKGISELELPSIYLSSDFSVHESEIHSDFSFPAHRVMQFLTRNLTDKDLENYKNQSNSYVSILDKWNIIEKAWSLTRNNKTQLAEQKIKEFSQYSDLLDNSLESAIYEFLREFIAFDNSKFDTFVKAHNWIHTIPLNEYGKFKDFFEENYEEHTRRYFEVFKSFFKNYSEFSQVQFSKFDNQDLVTTSNSFDNVKMFYGECFEHLTSNLEFLACLFNIKEGRRFDKFQKMSLIQYNGLDKANKLNPMKNTPEINDIFDSFNSKLRNASHHGHIFCENDIIKYKTSHDKDYNEIRYIDFLTECRKIFQSLCILFMLEIYFKKIILPKISNTNFPTKLSLGIRKAMFDS